MSPPGAALCLWHDCRGPVEDQKCQNELGVSSARPRMGGIRCNQSVIRLGGWKLRYRSFTRPLYT